jgi:biopolymer transport protein ExbB
MIVLFKVIALRGTGDAQAMADGISQALLTTEAGLVAAIPIILGHVLLTNRLNKITAKTKEVCLATIDYLKEPHA